MAESPNTQIPVTTTAQSSSSSEKPSEDATKQSQVPPFPGFPPSSAGSIKMLPIMYPALVPGLVPAQNHEQVGRGAGIYAVPVLPFTGPVAGLPSDTLIPLTYNIPTRSSTSEAGAVGGEQSQVGQQQQQQQFDPQRQIVVRRFQFAFQLDVLLILKLAAVIFLFNSQEGSRQRLAFLVFLASLVYLHQTGALAPLMRWVSQAMRRAAAPPRPPRPIARAEPVVRAANENIAAAEGQPGAENDNQLPDNANPVAEPGADGANHWWGIVKEIQMIVFGFITSLLPGFHNVDHA